MKRRLFAVLALLASFHTVCFAADLPDYIRYAENQRSARLEVAIRKFTMPTGQTADLIGVVHIADAAYYQQLNERFDSYDSVLFELVGDPEALTQNAPQRQAQQSTGSGVSLIQQAASKHLDLAFQLDAIDYSKKNMVHADATREEFARMEQERGENVLTLFVSAMQAQMSSGNRMAMRELDTFALIRILMSPDSAMEFKKALAKTFDQMESITAAMEGPKGSAILSGRNEVVLNKVREVLANKKQRRIAVFYGGAHMPGIESRLIKDLNAKAAGEEWLTAWEMPKANTATTATKP
ncbi:MAG TPA: hypothetical protein VFS58_02400 [Steroidobacteraceae bacterium]|nr:hypothetical protein [Steroidobacteraceae bacterium]